MKSKILMLICIILISFSCGIIVRQLLLTRHYNKIEVQGVIMKIAINTEFINVREKPTIKAKKVYEVQQGEKYEVLEVFEEETLHYTWYKILFSDHRVGWVASGNNNSWVVEIK